MTKETQVPKVCKVNVAKRVKPELAAHKAKKEQKASPQKFPLVKMLTAVIPSPSRIQAAPPLPSS